MFCRIKNNLPIGSVDISSLGICNEVNESIVGVKHPADTPEHDERWTNVPWPCCAQWTLATGVHEEPIFAFPASPFLFFVDSIDVFDQEISSMDEEQLV